MSPREQRQSATVAQQQAETASDLADAAMTYEMAGEIEQARALWAGAVAYAFTAHAFTLAALGVR